MSGGGLTQDVVHCCDIVIILELSVLKWRNPGNTFTAYY